MARKNLRGWWLQCEFHLCFYESLGEIHAAVRMVVAGTTGERHARFRRAWTCRGSCARRFLRGSQQQFYLGVDEPRWEAVEVQR